MKTKTAPSFSLGAERPATMATYCRPRQSALAFSPIGFFSGLAIGLVVDLMVRALA